MDKSCKIASEINQYWESIENNPEKQILNIFSKEELNSSPEKWKEIKKQKISLLSNTEKKVLQPLRAKFLNRKSAIKYSRKMRQTIKVLMKENEKLKQIIKNANL